MDEELRAAIWRRDKNTCQVCNKKLTETVTIRPEQSSINESLSIEEIRVFKWNRICWKCGKETPVVSYNLAYDVDYNIEDIEKLDNLLMQNYPFVKRTYSKAQGREVIANTCIHCGNLQGSSFIVDELADKMAETQDIDKQIALVLHTTLTSEDLNAEKSVSEKPYQAEVALARGEIHHKDGNWENDDPENLMLVCKNCHAKIKPVRGDVKTRKEVREQRRIRKEKLEADKWRENYALRKSSEKVKQRAFKQTTDINSFGLVHGATKE